MNLLKRVTLLLCLIMANSLAAQDNCDRLLGKWLSEDKDVQIEITRNGNRYEGKVIWSSKSDAKEKTGHTMLKDLICSAKEAKYHGKLISLSGSTASAEVTLVDKNTMKLYASRFVFSKTILWTRQQ